MFCNNQKDDFWADFEGDIFFFERVQNDTNRSAMTHLCLLYAAFANFGDTQFKFCKSIQFTVLLILKYFLS